MRRVLLFFMALAAVFCISAFVLIHSIDLTVLNEGYVISKIEEAGFYEKFIDSLSESSKGTGMEAKEFVEIIGINTIKPLVNSLISSILSYLKDPSIQKIEIGLPAGIFPGEASISLESLLEEEQISFFRQAKWVIQTMLVTRSVALLVSIALIVLMVVVARGIKSKVSWAGLSLLSSGILVIILSFPIQSFLFSVLDSLEFNETLIGFLKSFVSDYSSLVQLYGFLLFFIGAIALLSVFFFPRFFKSQKERTLKEKKEIEKKREETVAREKGYF